MEGTTGTAVGRRGAPLSAAQARALLALAGGEGDGSGIDGGEGGVHAHPAEGEAPNTAVATGLRRGTSAITLAVLGVLGFSVILPAESAQLPPNAARGSGSVTLPIPSTDHRMLGGDAGPLSPPKQESQTMFSKLRNAAVATTIGAAAITGGVSAQAVQWKVSDGGNGHWYGVHVNASGMNAAQALAYAATHGAKLLEACGAEFDWFYDHAGVTNPSAWRLVNPATNQYHGPYIGLSKASGDFRWPSGESCVFDRWAAGQPTNVQQETVVMFFVYGTPPTSRCHDVPPESVSNGVALEWDADCNHDGIVDYGQCRDGSLADFNGNNVPDCCERGLACVVGNYPVEWRASDGGNGHWYQRNAQALSWADARRFALARGGDLATLTNQAESDFAFDVDMRNGNCWLGGFQAAGACEPGCDWAWVTGEPWVYTAWRPGQPDNTSGTEDSLAFWGGQAVWNDGTGTVAAPSIIEWSADCNHDGIVDYGQILRGELADANGNGIPDVCESPTCRDADLFRDGQVNGADLAALLSQWGPANANTVSDINHDGRVDGFDLGVLLSFWGPCGP